MFKRILYYISWLPLAILDLFMSIIAYPLVPFVALFGIGKDDLPWYLSWFSTYDNGIDGDEGHHERWKSWIEWTEKHHLKHFGIYVKRVAWMWRNKMYNFSYHVTGRFIDVPVKWKGNPDSINDNKGGTGWLVLWNDNAWCVWGYQPWLRIGKYQFYLRLFLGWKFKSIVRQNPQIAQREMLAFFISPFRKKKIK